MCMDNENMEYKTVKVSDIHCLECDKQFKEGDLTHTQIDCFGQPTGFVCRDCFLKLQEQGNNYLNNVGNTIEVKKPLNLARYNDVKQ